MKRRDFIKTAALAGAAPLSGRAEDQTPSHRYIDRDRCIGCGQCVPLCPMGAITLDGYSRIDPDECAECGVCWRADVCPVDAIRPVKLGWPRSLREVFSNPLAEHESTGVPGRGTEGIKTNDSTGRYGENDIGVFVELGRPVLGARFADAEKVIMKFMSAGYKVVEDNPVNALIANRSTGALNPEVLNEKAISILVEFVLPRSDRPALDRLLAELAGEVDSVFSVSVALRADGDGHADFEGLFGRPPALPAGKVNIGFATGIAGDDQ